MEVFYLHCLRLDFDELLKPGMAAVIELSILHRHRNGSGLLKTLLVDNVI